MQNSPVYKDLVLIGGGHSHLAVLRQFGMRPIPGVRLTLVTPTSQTPYSGMLPGLVSGYYNHDEAHIDLAPLARFAGSRLIIAEAVGLTPGARQVRLQDRPALDYDVVSINIGSTPDLPKERHYQNITPVKPVDRFLAVWQRLIDNAHTRDHTSLALIGGGAAGVELALSMASHFKRNRHPLSITLFTADEIVLPTHNARVRAILSQALTRADVTVRTRACATPDGNGTVALDDGTRHSFDEVFWATHASPADWLRQSGLPTDENGFLLIDDYLRSTGDSRVFAAGDAATMMQSRRPKSGVFAVRQGRPLAQNLRRTLLGLPPKPYRPQKAFLSLIGSGDGVAVASRSRWAAQGRAVWQIKESIDRRFMARFKDLPATETMSVDRDLRIPDAVTAGKSVASSVDPLRCGGCGAKTSAAVLSAVLSDLNIESSADIIAGVDSPDDAALVRIAGSCITALTVDAFRQMIDDPYLFGQITANHCLNDLFAIGAAPHTALAIASLPDWPEAKLIGELRQMLAGAVATLHEAGATLVGGHTGESIETSLGFALRGTLRAGGALRKSGVHAGDALIISKAIGTGCLLAADMRGRARGQWLETAIASMRQSNRAAAQVFSQFGAHACTDVTGFGLIGHLIEMARPNTAAVVIDPDRIPQLDGTAECLASGIRSTMDPKNRALADGVNCDAKLLTDSLGALLLDPQTAGGLVAAVPGDQAATCVSALQDAGYRAATIFGFVRDIDCSDGLSVQAGRINA